MHKTNRNDPCPCGSGKKYKKCCLREHESRLNSYLSMTYHMVRVENKIQEYTTSRWNEEILIDALQEYKEDYDGPEIDFSLGPDQADDLAVFTNWFMFEYCPPGVSEAEYKELDQLWLKGEIDYYTPTLAQQALRFRADLFTPAEKAYIEQALVARYTFLEIKSHDPATEETTALDLTSNQIISLTTPPVLKVVDPNSIVFGKLLTIEARTYLLPMGDAIFNPQVKPEFHSFVVDLVAEAAQPRALETRLGFNASMLTLYCGLRT